MANVFFGYPYEWDTSRGEYGIAIRRAVRDLHHGVSIAKEVPASSPIMTHVRELIEEADLAFFDITGLNPNVLIECGVGLASETKCFLIADRMLHTSVERTLFGERRSAIETPTDLKAYNLELYDNTGQLREFIQRTIRHHLQTETEIQRKRAQIKDALKKLQPINMSSIAQTAGMSVDDVRPVLKGLVALNEVTRLGNGRGTRYRLS